jgi:uncharacterized membrane protein YfcA
MTEWWLGVIGLIICLIGILVGNAVGAGAGGFVVPCLFLCFGYSLAQAVALWNASTLLTAAFRVINSGIINEKHPEGDRPIIDFNSVLMFQPLLFIGIEIGFILMEILAEAHYFFGFIDWNGNFYNKESFY